MEKQNLLNHISTCCEKSVYVYKNTIGKGLWCSGCNKEIYNTIDSKSWHKDKSYQCNKEITNALS